MISQSSFSSYVVSSSRQVGLRALVAAGLLASLSGVRSLHAAEAANVTVQPIDRVAVRWYAPATGGVDKPQFISASMLAFLARIEAMLSTVPKGQAYESKHIRMALQRHMTESILASLPVTPAPTPKQVADYAEDARMMLERQVANRQARDGKKLPSDKASRIGRGLVARAAVAEGIEAIDLNALLRRRARASWYLDKMVAPMLEPSTADLIATQRSGETPYTHDSFEKVRKELRDWFLATRLALAIDRYYRNVRGTVNVALIMPPGR
jgi:hypothetical protein